MYKHSVQQIMQQKVQQKMQQKVQQKWFVFTKLVESLISLLRAWILNWGSKFFFRIFNKTKTQNKPIFQ